MTELNLARKPHVCTCGHHESDDLPELDARLLPPVIRHAAIIGAVGSLSAGQALALIAPHDPKPLLRQLRDEFGESLEVTYLVSGPEAWKLKLARV